MMRLALVLTILVAGCSSAPPNPDARASQLQARAAAEDRHGDFVLSISTERGVQPAGEPIEIATTLEYIGEEERTVELWGSGGGVVRFDVRQVDGTFHTEAVMTSDCAPHEVSRDAPISVPFQKSGAWDPQDPASSPIEAFLNDPLLRLPAGRWEIIARATFLVGDCELPQVELATSVVVVTEEAASP